MYSSGDISNFASRLHQLPTGILELQNYRLEATGANYTGIAARYQNTKWNKEFNYQWFRFTNDGAMLTTGTWFI